MRHLVITMLLIVAMLAAPVAMFALQAGPYAACSTDTDCAERFGGNGDPE